VRSSAHVVPSSQWAASSHQPTLSFRFDLSVMRNQPPNMLTGQLAQFVLDSRWEGIPAAVRHESVRAFVNWVGCAYGGASHPAVSAAIDGLNGLAVSRQCTLLGYTYRLDPLNAALVNGLSVSVHAFDDAHLVTVAHPTAPSVAALLAYAELNAVSGPDFLHALVLSNEIQSRISCALGAPPASCHIGHYMTGLTGAVGVAAGIGKLMGLSAQQILWAMGVAAMQGGGLRASHGTMSCAFIPGNAGRNGLLAAHMAASGFTCHDDALGTDNGLLQVFGSPANPDALSDRLGSHFECMNVEPKPYPAGCLVHATIDACMELVRAHTFEPDQVARIELQVHELALGLTGRRKPQHSYDAQASVYHWAAAVLLHRRAGLAEASDACVQNPAVVALRARVVASVAKDLPADAARVRVTLLNGGYLEASVGTCLGSTQRPMSDDQIAAKFLAQAETALGTDRARQLADICWDLPSVDDVSRCAPGFWGPGEP
jgi:2-methylcitrate dehydratase PrpD